MKKILYIASFIPYKMPGAGAKTSYQSLDYLSKSNKIDLISFYTKVEKPYLDELKIYIEQNDNINLIGLHLVNNTKRVVNALLFPFFPILLVTRFNISMFFKLRNVSKNNYSLIYSEWTQSIVLSSIISKIINVPFVISVQDVIIQSFHRKYRLNKNIFFKIFYFFEYLKLRYFEIAFLNKSRSVIIQNNKDKLLLQEYGVKVPISVITPYVDFSFQFKPKKINEEESFNILFWGAMNRVENTDAVFYYLSNIHDKLVEKIPNLKFYIAGANPPEELIKYDNKNIQVTGFIDDPSDLFNKMHCAFFPLRLGAGIKVKTLEALYMGLPTVTTNVGAEGIDIGEDMGLFIRNNETEMISCLYDLYRRKIKFNSEELNLKIMQLYDFKNNYLVFDNIINSYGDTK